MKSGLLSCALLACLLSGTALAAPPAVPATQQHEKVFNADTFTLANGMQVVVIPNHRAPVVTHMVWYKVGSADEPQGDGISGVAHYLEHLMFKGTNVIGPGDFSKIIRSWGGEDNAFTSWDYTAYFQSIAKDYLPRVMAFEADRMVNLAPPADQVKSELQVVIEERRQRTDNDPRTLFSEQMRAALFNTSPYGIPIIGWKDEMPKMEWRHMRDYYKTWYAPNNAILIVSGDITAAELKPLAEKYYGVLKSREIPPHIRPAVPAFAAEQKLTLRHEDVRQPALLQAWLAPAYLENKQESLALQVLIEMISGGPSTRLYQSLVTTQKLASAVHLSYDGDSRGAGSIWLYAIPVPGVSLDSLQAAFAREISLMIDEPFKKDDMERAKTRLIDSAIYARDSVSGPAMIIGRNLAAGATLDDIETWPEQISKVSVADVQAVLKKYLSPVDPAFQPVTGYMLPKESTK